MIDNREYIKPLLNFEDEGDFYYLGVYKRKKDQPVGERHNHQSVRTVKAYSITSWEYLESRWDEIVQLCEMFKARAYIHVQKQNFKDVGLLMIQEIAERIKNENYKLAHVFDSVVGKMKVYEKRWVVDVDTKDLEQISIIRGAIHGCEPLGKNKILAQIPTKQGVHLITERFDVQEFRLIMGYDCPDIQKRNPTLLMIPNSLL